MLVMITTVINQNDTKNSRDHSVPDAAVHPSIITCQLFTIKSSNKVTNAEAKSLKLFAQ